MRGRNLCLVGHTVCTHPTKGHPHALESDLSNTASEHEGTPWGRGRGRGRQPFCPHFACCSQLSWPLFTDVLSVCQIIGWYPRVALLWRYTLHSLLSPLRFHLPFYYYANECRHLIPAFFTS